MAPFLNAAGWLRVSSNELFHADDAWWANHPALQAQAHALSLQLEDLIENIVHHFHPEVPAEQLADLGTNFVLTMQRHNADAVYVHVGDYTPNSLQRFSIGKLRAAGTGVKPWGVASGTPATWQNGALNDPQEAVMTHALHFMDALALQMPQNGPFGGFGGGGGFDAGLDVGFGPMVVGMGGAGLLLLPPFINQGLQQPAALPHFIHALPAAVGEGDESDDGDHNNMLIEELE